MAAAAFGRLCVETTLAEKWLSILVAAAFGRLCVETVGISSKHFGYGGSRLRAAVC